MKLDIIDEKGKIVKSKDSELVHENGLLHRSVHLLICDSQGLILARKRGTEKPRYQNMWTSSLGTHVLSGENYLSTLNDYLKEISSENINLKYLGEFRVKDQFENEICGLYVTQLNKAQIKSDFLLNREYLQLSNLENIIRDNGATPHLANAYESYCENGRIL